MASRAGSVDRWLGRCCSNLARVWHSIILHVLGALEFLLVHGSLRVLAEQRRKLIGSACTTDSESGSERQQQDGEGVSHHSFRRSSL